MSKPILNRQLLESLKREAKKKARENTSLGYNQWLNVLSAPYGFNSYDSLRHYIEQLEQEERARAEASAEMQWQKRLQGPKVWGKVKAKDKLDETLPLPISAGFLVWPNCFAGSSLFTCASGLRREINGELFSDGPQMHFVGEELRVEDDEIVLQALISVAGQYPCGRLVKFNTDDLDKVTGAPLPEWGVPVQYADIVRSLWRLAHCQLKVEAFKFSGPILSYVDAREEPQVFAIRFNPDFANFFYPILKLFC